MKHRGMIEGTIRLPEHQRNTHRAFEGAKVRFLALLPGGKVKVKLLQDVGLRDKKGQDLTLLPGCFVKKA